jgi:hypothetical protein
MKHRLFSILIQIRGTKIHARLAIFIEEKVRIEIRSLLEA